MLLDIDNPPPHVGGYITIENALNSAAFSMEPMYPISEARLEDVAQLSELLGILFAQELEFTSDRSRQEKGIRLILENPGTGRIFCARKGNRTVGMVNLLFTISTAEGGRVAWLEDLVVHPEFRGLGIGHALLQRALHEARTLGCLRVTLLTDSTNEGAARLYQREGFTRSSMVPMRLKF